MVRTPSLKNKFQDKGWFSMFIANLKLCNYDTVVHKKMFRIKKCWVFWWKDMRKKCLNDLEFRTTTPEMPAASRSASLQLCTVVFQSSSFHLSELRIVERSSFHLLNMFFFESCHPGTISCFSFKIRSESFSNVLPNSPVWWRTSEGSTS